MPGRAVNAPHLVALVRPGAIFHKGKLLERLKGHSTVGSVCVGEQFSEARLLTPLGELHLQILRNAKALKGPSSSRRESR